jgi:hypothetical protein
VGSSSPASTPRETEPDPAPTKSRRRLPRFPRIRFRRPWHRVAFGVGLPLLVSAAVVTLMVTLCQTAFEINDDSTLNAIVNGDYTGKRSSSLVVAPVMFAHVMRLGYALLPNVPWYGLTLYALQIIAWAAIGAVAFTLRRRPAVPELLVVVATMLVLAPWMILRVSFTPVALLLATAGLLVFAASAKVPGRVGTAYAVVAGLLAGTASLVRTYSLLGVVVAFAPVLVVIVFKVGIRRSAVCACVILMFLLVGFGTNKLQYGRSAEWRNFTKMNAARSSLHATPRVSDKNVTRRDLNKIGWSENDLKLFADFYYPDRRVYSSRAIRTLAQMSPRVRDDTESASHIFDYLRGPFVALPLLVAVMLAFRRNRYAALFTLASAVWFVAVLVTLILYVRLPSRVLIPLEGAATFIAVIVPAYLAPLKPGKNERSWMSIAVIALVVLLLAGTAFDGVRSPNRISSDNTRAIRKRTRAYDALLDIDPKGVFLARGDFFGLNADPLSTHTPFENPRFIPLGWATNSPLFNERLKRIGITDLYRSLVRNPHVYLYGTGTEVRRVALYYKQHRGGTVEFARATEHTLYGYGVWTFHHVPTPPKKPVARKKPVVSKKAAVQPAG